MWEGGHTFASGSTVSPLKFDPCHCTMNLRLAPEPIEPFRRATLYARPSNSSSSSSSLCAGGVRFDNPRVPLSRASLYDTR